MASSGGNNANGVSYQYTAPIIQNNNTYSTPNLNNNTNHHSIYTTCRTCNGSGVCPRCKGQRKMFFLCTF